MLSYLQNLHLWSINIVKVTSISFGSAYIGNDVKHLLSAKQQQAIYELGKNYPDKHIIAGLSALDKPKSAKRLLLRVNDAISAKELSRLFIPINFSPEHIGKYPKYIFHA